MNALFIRRSSYWPPKFPEHWPCTLTWNVFTPFDLEEELFRTIISKPRPFAKSSKSSSTTMVPPPRVNLVPGINNGSSSSLPYFTPHNQPLKMKQIKCSETSAFNNQTPGKYPKITHKTVIKFEEMFSSMFYHTILWNLLKIRCNKS